MFLRKLLFIIVSCKGCSTEVSLGRKKPFQKTLPLFMWDGLSALLGKKCIVVPDLISYIYQRLNFWKVSVHYIISHTVFASSPCPETKQVLCGSFWAVFVSVSFLSLSGNTLHTLLRKAFVGDLQVYVFCFTNNWRLK